jgi:hypothetical protein
MDDTVTTQEPTSWFGRLSNSIQSFSKPKAPPHKLTADDVYMELMVKTVKDIETETNNAFDIVKTLTAARLDLCACSVEWAQSLVASPIKPEASPEELMEGVCSGMSGRMVLFGEMSQRTIAATAEQENKLLSKLLTERIEMLTETQNALSTRNKALKELISAKAASFRCGEAVTRAKSADGPDRDKLKADLAAAQKAHYMAQAVVVRLEKKLKEATTRLKREWIRVNDEWVAMFKVGLLEAAYANQRMHQMHTASLSSLLSTLKEEQQ